MEDNNTADVWTEEIEAKGQQNLKNLQEYQDIEKQLKLLRAKQQALKHQFKRSSLATILKDNPSYWDQLKNSEKWKKENVLIVFKSSKLRIPSKLSEPNFQTSAPQALLNDPDIFLARIRHPQFRNFRISHDNHDLPMSETLFEKLVASKQIHQVVEQYPGALGEWQFPNSHNVLWSSPEIYEAYLKAYNFYNMVHTNLKMEFLPEFDASLRNDKILFTNLYRNLDLSFAVVRLVLKHSWLRNDKSTAQLIISKQSELPDDALKAFSQKLRNDFELVQQVVSINGRCLKHASYSLRRNRKIAEIAVSQNASALRFVFNSARKKLLRLDVMRRLLAECAKHHWESQPNELYQRIYKECKPEVQNDPEIVVWAFECDILSEIPLALRGDTSFWKAAVKISSNMWYSLDKPSVDVAKCINEFDTDLWTDVVEKLPALINDRELWMRCAKQGEFVGDVEIPRHILLDREIILEACRNDPETLEFLDGNILTQPLTVDREVLEACMECRCDEYDYNIIYHMTEEAQFMYPDIVAKAIDMFEADGDVWELFDEIEDELWMNRDVCLAWVRKGGEYLHDEFPEEIENDKEIFKIIAERNPQDFWCSSEELCADKEFMKEIVRINPLLLEEASDEVSRDFAVALEAIGGLSRRSLQLVGRYNVNKKDDLSFLVSFARKVRSKIASHMAFAQILCGMKFGVDTPLTMLSQGQETSLAHKKRIAEFLGVAKGEELRLLRQASFNLSKWGY